MRKIAIVAKGGTSALAPWHDETWEIWGMPWISYPRCDVYFDVHEQGMYDNPTKESDDTWLKQEWINNIGDKPIYCPKSRMHLPNAIELPMEEITKSIPIPYYENTIAYMMAKAIHDKVDAIGLWGVHMRGQYEYEAERPSITYLTGLAQGRGIEVFIQPGNPLFASVWEQGRYGVNGRQRQMHPCFTARLK